MVEQTHIVFLSEQTKHNKASSCYQSSDSSFMFSRPIWAWTNDEKMGSWTQKCTETPSTPPTLTAMRTHLNRYEFSTHFMSLYCCFICILLSLCAVIFFLLTRQHVCCEKKIKNPRGSNIFSVLNPFINFIRRHQSSAPPVTAHLYPFLKLLLFNHFWKSSTCFARHGGITSAQ